MLKEKLESYFKIFKNKEPYCRGNRSVRLNIQFNLSPNIIDKLVDQKDSEIVFAFDSFQLYFRIPISFIAHLLYSDKDKRYYINLRNKGRYKNLWSPTIK